MSLKPKNQLKSNEEGIVAIIIAVLMMLVLSLIVLAISQNATREQRQALDRQLSDQAFYNAESGINDAAAALYQNKDNAAVPNKWDRCDSLPTALGLDNSIDASGTNKYTCLQYDRIPPTIQYDELSISTPKVLRVKAVDASGNPVVLENLTISWDDSADRDAAITGKCNFTNGAPELPTNCGYGGVKVEVVNPLNSRDLIKQFTSILYLLPSTLVGNAPYDMTGIAYPDNQGILTGSDCSGGAGQRRCSKTINKINGNNFFLSIRALYQPVNVTISGTNAGNPVYFKDAQIMIDSTGKSADVLRRVKVRLPAANMFTFPGAALQSKDSICKYISVNKNENGTGNAASDDAANCPIN